MSFDLALIDGDLKIDPDGTIKTVNDTEKLRQDILKIIVTPIGSNKYHLWYGTNISPKIIGSAPSESFMKNEIAFAVQDSLLRLQKLQRAQASEQNVSLAEIISNINDVVAQRSPTDPRLINVYVSVVSKALTRIDEGFKFRG